MFSPSFFFTPSTFSFALVSLSCSLSGTPAELAVDVNIPPAAGRVLITYGLIGGKGHLRTGTRTRDEKINVQSPFRALCRMTCVSELDMLETRHRHWAHCGVSKCSVPTASSWHVRASKRAHCDISGHSRPQLRTRSCCGPAAVKLVT